MVHCLKTFYKAYGTDFMIDANGVKSKIFSIFAYVSLSLLLKRKGRQEELENDLYATNTQKNPLLLVWGCSFASHGCKVYRKLEEVLSRL